MNATHVRPYQVVEGWERLPKGFTHRDCVGVSVDAQDNVYLLTRGQSRVLVYSSEGTFLYVAELWWRVGDRSPVHGENVADRPGRVSIFDAAGRLLTRWGGPDRCAPGAFVAPHDICVDARGDLYVGEVTYTHGGQAGLVPSDCHTFQKFRRNN